MSPISPVQMALNPQRSESRLQRWTQAAVIHLIILLGAFLIAVEFRLRLAIGSTLGAAYDAQPVLAFLFLALGGAVGGIVTTQIPRLSSRRRLFLGLISGTALAFLAFAFLLPDLSLLQVAYFVGMALVLGLLILLIPPQSLTANWLQRLWEQRSLL